MEWRIYLLQTVPTEASFFNRNVFDSNISVSVRNTVRAAARQRRGREKGENREG